MIFRQLFDVDSSTYTYLIADEITREALFIDAVKNRLNTYLQLLRELDVKLIKAIDTHVHADHVTALGDLRDATGCITLMGEQSSAPCVNERFADGDMIGIGALKLQAMYTPGHTDDSYSFYLQADNRGYVFTGDTLLIRGSGRTDFQSGSADAQYDSLFNKLLTLPENTVVYPGHDYKGWTSSSIGEEKHHNPRLQVKNKEAYIELMNNLKLPHPQLMDIAVPANQACGKS
jgi:glyoxylase-like metal-dependent hydrolase (beta-lactamase superfamily II)